MDKKEMRGKIHWATPIDDSVIGNGYGYRIHNQELKKATERIATITEDAEDALIILSPEFYTDRVPGKANWLFTMFEGTELPLIYQRSIQKADFLLAPSTWVAELLRKYFDRDRIFVVPHGISRDFTYKKRLYPVNKPFRYLWIGAPNPRKGYEELIYTWDIVFKDDLSTELYMKTTLVGNEKLYSGLEKKKGKKGNVILDGRDITRKELIELYHSAHCFVFPTRGEGFGFTLAEAMATGCPSIATLYSGVTDFFNTLVGYPIGYKMDRGKVSFIGAKPDEAEHETDMAMPDVEDLVCAMADVRMNYGIATDKAAAASKKIRTEFTWGKAARTLMEIINVHGGLKNIRKHPVNINTGGKKKDRKIITFVGYNRSGYTKRVLEGLSKCKGIEEYTFLPCIEPGNDEVIAMIKNIDFMKSDVVINRRRLDCTENTFQALSRGFGLSDYVIHFEDDIVPAEDCLIYFEWAKEKFKDSFPVFTICAYNKIEKKKFKDKDAYKTFGKLWFTPWGWATWESRWKEIENNWGLNKKYSWDVFMNFKLRNVRYEIRPTLGRTQNIGAEGGRYVPNKEFHKEKQFNEFWAGSFKELPKGEF